jgi:hypothetical protein
MMSEANDGSAAQARLLTLPQGLYSLQVLLRDAKARDAELPIRLAVPPAAGNATNDVVLSSAGPDWQYLSASSHVAFADVKSSNGVILVCAAACSEAAADLFDILVAKLDLASAQPQDHRGIPTKIKLRLERLGWRTFSGNGWATSRNGHLRILAIGLDAQNPPPAPNVELRVFASGNRQTDWQAVGEVAGFTEADATLTGFAARLPQGDPHGNLSVGYSGEFKEAGRIGAYSDGEICQSPIVDDPLIGVSLWIGRRGAG